MRLGEKVERVEWSDAQQRYTVRTSPGVEHGPFTAVISAVGFRNIPILPPFARGQTAFRGEVTHTSTWPEGLDLAGKAVGVVGTGSSAVQVGREAEKVAASVKVFQREANWLVPKDARDFTALERWLNRRRPGFALRRRLLYWRYDLRQVFGRHVVEGSRMHRRRARLSRDFLARSLGDQPRLMRAVTPDHVFEGRRVVLSDTYYEMLKSDRVTLVPHSVSELTQAGVRDESGEEHALDVVVLAYEAQARFAARPVERMSRRGNTRVGVRKRAFVAYQRLAAAAALEDGLVSGRELLPRSDRQGRLATAAQRDRVHRGPADRGAACGPLRR